MVGAETLAAGGVAVVVGAEDEAGAVQATANHMVSIVCFSLDHVSLKSTCIWAGICSHQVE